MARKLPDNIEAAIQRTAQQAGIDPAILRTFVLIESGGNPSNVTGSYQGLLQLSNQEFAKHGGQGNILDVDANLSAGARKLSADAANFSNRFGRDPSASELYLIHQQGVGGSAAHWANPDKPAWQNMASTAEGRQKGEKWAKAAIWGNVPDDVKAQFGSVDNLTSRDFVKLWDDKVARFSGGSPSSMVASSPAPISTPQPVSTGSGNTEAAGLLASLFGQQQQQQREQQSPFESLMSQVGQTNIPTAPTPEASPGPIRPVDPAQLLAIVSRRQKLGTA